MSDGQTQQRTVDEFADRNMFLQLLQGYLSWSAGLEAQCHERARSDLSSATVKERQQLEATTDLVLGVLAIAHAARAHIGASVAPTSPAGQRDQCAKPAQHDVRSLLR